MNKEIEEMRKVVCKQCLCVCEKANCEYANDIAKEYYNAGYHKTEVKTNGDKIRSMSDEELANYLITSDYYYDEGVKIKHITPKGSFLSRTEAYNANLDWLKQEHKGENQ